MDTLMTDTMDTRTDITIDTGAQIVENTITMATITIQDTQEEGITEEAEEDITTEDEGAEDIIAEENNLLAKQKNKEESQ